MATKKRNTGLGKGLDALFADIEPAVESDSAKTTGGVETIGIDEIKPNAAQPRKTFDKEKLDDMAASIVASAVAGVVPSLPSSPSVAT